MRGTHRIRPFAVAALAAGLLCAGSASAGAAAPAPLPAHLYAPYLETWTASRPAETAQRSGVNHFTLAFVQTPAPGSCVPTWNGDPSQPVAGGEYVADIAALRARGGDVIVSFGGASADNGKLTELADSCTSLPKLVKAYETVVTTLGVTRLDMDVEGKSVHDTAGINRRNEAIASVEAWAAAQGRTLQISYTLEATETGLDRASLAILKNAIADGARIDIVNLMTFDWYDGTTAMATAAESSATGLHAQLAALYPAKTSAQRWRMEGLTLMPGIDDNPDKAEVTTVANARSIEHFAATRGLGLLSIWAIERDNGGCPGRNGANGCSGIAQKQWAFSRVLQPFTSN